MESGQESGCWLPEAGPRWGSEAGNALFPNLCVAARGIHLTQIQQSKFYNKYKAVKYIYYI